MVWRVKLRRWSVECEGKKMEYSTSASHCIIKQFAQLSPETPVWHNTQHRYQSIQHMEKSRVHKVDVLWRELVWLGLVLWLGG